jgi:hypothetical protein
MTYFAVVPETMEELVTRLKGDARLAAIAARVGRDGIDDGCVLGTRLR